MKRFLKLSANAQSKPVRLLASLALAFGVMVFINGFIGSMGGLPAFIAFASVFYVLRSVMSAGNRITHQLAMTSRRELGYLFVDYSLSYLALWALFRLGLTFSRVTGWGNINGASALEYLRGLMEISLLEKWAYFFVGVLMFAFVLSLFPLVVMKKPGSWAAYALLDTAVFALLCELLGGISRISIGDRLFGRGICLIDYLLLCVDLTDGKKIACLLGVLAFTLAVGIFSFFFAVRCYAPRRGQIAELSAAAPGRQGRASDLRAFRRNALPIGAGVLLLGAIMALVFFGPEDTPPEYEKVAEYLTEDAALGPMAYQGTVYIPIDEESALYEEGTPQGYLAKKGEECDSRLYELTVGNVLYTEKVPSKGHIQVYGADIKSFAPAEELEASGLWRADEIFLLWDEDWVQESAYSHEPTGYTVCGREFVEALEQKFGAVSYQIGDFSDYDAYFSLCGYADFKHATTEELTPGDWVGCVLVKDNQFFYGSRDNRITGALLLELLDILGGY